MTADRAGLERIHGYIGRSFPAIGSPAQAACFRLSEEQLHRFHHDGFVAGVAVLDEAAVAEVAGRLDWLQENARDLEHELYEVELAWSERPHEVVFHCLGGWLIDECLHDLVFHPAVTVPCAQCLGVRQLRLWHDQVFSKPPRHPGVVPWHQDYSYWQRTAPAAHVTMHIALDPTGEDNGCIHYVPGSHRWELGPRVAFGGPMDALLDRLPRDRRREFRPRPIRLQPGEGVIHHSLTVHGSFANRSDRPRRAAVLNYMADGVRVAEAGPLLRGVPEIPPGAAVAGAHFPVVLDLDSW